MKTQRQDVVSEKNTLSELKTAFTDQLRLYLSTAGDSSRDRDNALLRCQTAANAYFNHAENFVGNSSLLGAHDNALWVQGFAEDCAEILLSMPRYYELLKIGFEDSLQLIHSDWKPGSTAFANMQRMVVKYLDQSKVKEVEDIFRRQNLPTYGFDNKEKNFMQRDKLLSFIFGLIFIVVLLVIAWFKPEPSKFQYSVFRTILALAGAGIGAVIPGTIQVDVKTWVRAGGAIAVFVIVYFFVPAQFT